MHILIVHDGIIPVSRYGGTERVIWYLGKELARMGHRVSYLVRKGSSCDFGTVHWLDPSRALSDQLPCEADVVHFQNAPPRTPVPAPYIVTVHGNAAGKTEYDANTVFVSQNHAARNGSRSYVYNGLDWDDYGSPDWHAPRRYAHFLGDAAWKVKNLRGAIRVVTSVPGERLAVLGGYRVNIRMGFRVTLHPRVTFCGMVGGERKLALLRHSKALLFPVRWHEPFGLALVESLYFGAPVLGTPHGSLPEIVLPEVGCLSTQSSVLTQALKDIGQYSPRRCHEYARDCFNARRMAEEYVKKYLTVADGKPLNERPPQGPEPTAKLLDWE
ncbi:MAG: glycosyltransferase [Prevotellaceae bacterium]|jgi:glycosyltransferase involved in cell wall biosynthesis|nr:glycosyltransferase [Prevotellaceae bacterium]